MSQAHKILAVFIILILGIIPVSASINLTANNDTVNYGGYYTVTSGTLDWGYIATGERHFLTAQHQSRIRQNGTLTEIEVYYNASPNISKIYFEIWRQNTTITWDRVSREDISSKLSSGINRVSLSTPVLVKEGDFVGYGIVTTGTSKFQFNATYGTVAAATYYNNAEVGTIGFDWTGVTASSTSYVKITTYGYSSPVIVGIGDSIMAGHGASSPHYSFIEATKTTNIPTQILHQLSIMLGNATYQNMGIGGQTTTQTKNRFTNDVVNVSPNVVIIEGGVNDIAGGSITGQTYLSNIASQINATLSINATPIVLTIMPWSDGTDAEMYIRDDWTTNLTQFVSSTYPEGTVYLVDTDSWIGEYRASGPASNLWDIAAAYDSGDGVHLNSAGNVQVARAIYAALYPPPDIPFTGEFNPSVDYHPDCPWWRFGIACDHLIKLTV